MTVLIYTLKRLFRNKANLFLTLLIPAVAIGVVFGVGDFGSATLSVGLVDLDKTPLTQMLAQSLEETSNVVLIEEDGIRQALASGQIDYALVVDSGFSEEIINNQDPSLRGYSIQETNMSRPIKFNVEGFLGAAKGLAATAAGDQDEFYKGLNDYHAGSFVLDSQAYSDAGKSVNNALGGMGLLAMTMMMLSSVTAVNLIKDRDNRTFFRVLASPVTLKSYMLQNILCSLTLLLTQVAIVLLIVRFVFGFHLGASLLSLYAVMAVFALLCVSMGVALAALARTIQQAGTIASLVITPMSMLGGLFWPRTIMPDILQTIGKFIPTTWVMSAAEKVMLGNSWSSAAPDLAILLGFTLVFFLLGTWRQTDIAR